MVFGVFHYGKYYALIFSKACLVESLLTFSSRLAYLIFDGVIVLFVSSLITIIFAAAVPHAWWKLGDLFVCLFLYGIASIHLSYTISLFAKSQLAAFAFCAGGQACVSPTLVATFN